MNVSIVKESKTKEKRVVLLPKEVKKLSSLNINLLIEEGAGEGVNYSDKDYKEVGSNIEIVDKKTAWSESNFILKLKRPKISELTRVKRQTAIGALFHAEGAPKLVNKLLEKEIEAYSYELFKKDSDFPLMSPTGEIAGKQAIIYASYHLQTHLEGSGRLITKTTHGDKSKVVILGYGNVGKAAAKLAKAMGAKVIVFRWSKKEGETKNKDGIRFAPWKKHIANKIIPTADVVIGAIRISTFDTPVFITKEMVKNMKSGSIIMDVTAGYGSGYIETSNKTTSFQDPYFTIHEVKHMKLRTLPLGVHQTAAKEISSTYAPHIYKLIKAKIENSRYPVAEKGKVTENGKITHKVVKKHYNRKNEGEL